MRNDFIKEGHLRLMVASDLESILKIRNHPEVRRYMVTQHEISLKKHKLWFEKVSNDPNVTLFIFDINKVCAGFVQLKKTSNPEIADWGFYLTPDAPKGTGSKLGNAALFQAFEMKKFHKICGQILDFNKPSIAFHKSLGFIQDGVLKRHHHSGEKYHDLICFGLVKSEWSKFKNLKEHSHDCHR